MAVQKMRSAKKKRRINNVIVHTSLAVLAAVWVFPIIWVVLTSFRAEKGSYVSTFFPKEFTLDNYIKLILSILVYTFFSRMFDLMLPPVAKHSIVVA